MIFYLPLYRDSIQLCYFLFYPQKKKKRLQQAMVAQINNVRTAANMLNLFLDRSNGSMIFFLINFFFKEF